MTLLPSSTPWPLSWTCMVCGEERPDAQISVAYRPILQLPDQFPECRWNVRYCNDRPACTAAACAAGPWPPAPASEPSRVEEE